MGYTLVTLVNRAKANNYDTVVDLIRIARAVQELLSDHATVVALENAWGEDGSSDWLNHDLSLHLIVCHTVSLFHARVLEVMLCSD